MSNLNGVRERLESVDALRGIAMVLMALDHTRSFLSNAQFAPVDLAHTTPALFFTRWVTHFCAPAFFLLAGVGASLSLARGRSLAQVSRFFLTRGLWLVVLELTLVSFGWDFTLHVTPWLAGVIWALGWSMVFMAALAWLPRGAIAAVGIALIVLHNMTDAITPAAFGEFGWLWRFLHFPDPHAGTLIRIDYPIIPWVGVMAVGYAMGPLFRESPRTQAEDSRRYRRLGRHRFYRSSMAEQLWRSDAVECRDTRHVYPALIPACA